MGKTTGDDTSALESGSNCLEAVCTLMLNMFRREIPKSGDLQHRYQLVCRRMFDAVSLHHGAGLTGFDPSPWKDTLLDYDESNLVESEPLESRWFEFQQQLDVSLESRESLPAFVREVQPRPRSLHNIARIDVGITQPRSFNTGLFIEPEPLTFLSWHEGALQSQRMILSQMIEITLMPGRERALGSFEVYFVRWADAWSYTDWNNIRAGVVRERGLFAETESGGSASDVAKQPLGGDVSLGIGNSEERPPAQEAGAAERPSGGQADDDSLPRLVIDTAIYEVSLGERRIHLGNTMNFRLLDLLASRPHGLIEHREITQSIDASSKVSGLIYNLRMRLRDEGLEAIADCIRSERRAYGLFPEGFLLERPSL